MQTSILLKVPGKPSTSPAVTAPSTVPGRIPNAVRTAFRAIFSPQATAAVGVLLLGAMLWHLATIPATQAAERAVATDVACALPWGIVAAIRATVAAIRQLRKGGEA